MRWIRVYARLAALRFDCVCCGSGRRQYKCCSVPEETQALNVFLANAVLFLASVFDKA
jgi:hypothetical protein